MPRPRTVYRGKRKYSWIITLAAMILVAVILFSVWLFYSLQKYIVYDKDGLHLEFASRRRAILRADDPDTADLVIPRQSLDVEIVVEQKDYSTVESSAGDDLTPIHALFLPAERVDGSNLNFYKNGMGDYDALVLELKTPDGFLHYESDVALAASYALNGTLDLRTEAAELKEAGIYLAAQISTLQDDTMARRNSPIAIKNAASAEVFSDGNGMAYLDPYSDTVRAYLSGLIAELADMGFDEILLDGLCCPDSELLRFNGAMTHTPTPAEAVNALAFRLREQADALGVRLSVVIDREALGTETVLQGQDPAVLEKAFDRLVVNTDNIHAAEDAEALFRILGSTISPRAALMAQGFTPSAPSCILK